MSFSGVPLWFFILAFAFFITFFIVSEWLTRK